MIDVKKFKKDLESAQETSQSFIINSGVKPLNYNDNGFPNVATPLKKKLC